MTASAGGRAWEPGKSAFVFTAGKKGSGKSHLAYTIWDSYPYDRLVIDVTRDVHRDWVGPLEVRHKVVTPESIPLVWPSSDLDEEGERPAALVYHPDMGSPTAIDDIDRMIGVALSKHHVCVWIDEIGAVTKASSTPPNLARLLHYGRHTHTSAIMCGPRPKNIDPLCVAQADYLGIFRLNNRADRQRICENADIPLDEYDHANAGLGDYEYLWYDARADTMTHMPPLPPIKQKPIYSEVPT